MYVRLTPGKPRKDGSRAQYVQLAHNRWDPVKGRSQVQVGYNFGRADTVDVAGMRRLAASITRFADSGVAGPEPVDGAVGAEAANCLRLISSRPMGAAWLLLSLVICLSA